jgi:hypothetical protein
MDNVPMGARASHAKRPYRRERQFVANDDFQHRSTSMMLYIHAGFYRDKDGRKAGLFHAYQSAAWCSFTSNLHARPSSRHVCFALIAPELADGI